MARTYETRITARINVFDINGEGKGGWATLPSGARIKVEDDFGPTVTVTEIATGVMGQADRLAVAAHTP